MRRLMILFQYETENLFNVESSGVRIVSLAELMIPIDLQL
jgi:hypothetical protein